MEDNTGLSSTHTPAAMVAVLPPEKPVMSANNGSSNTTTRMTTENTPALPTPADEQAPTLKQPPSYSTQNDETKPPSSPAATEVESTTLLAESSTNHDTAGMTSTTAPTPDVMIQPGTAVPPETISAQESSFLGGGGGGSGGGGGPDEGLLRDVLDELDRERSKRAEMEAKIRQLEDNLRGMKKQLKKATGPSATNASTTHNTNFHDFTVLKTERDGYLEIVNALTRNRPALSKKPPPTRTRQQPQNTLPLHVLRLLEIMPWDARARPHLFGEETLYEWQALNTTDNTWQTRLRYFPTIFKTLPIVVPQPGHTLTEAPTSSSPPKQCVLTNLQMTQIVNIDTGFPLPKDGGVWMWVGGWRVETSNDTDDRGWSYSNAPQLGGAESTFYSELRMPAPGARNIMKRRRKWTRSRALVDYPYASTATKEYLKLLADKSRLEVSVDKLSHQLVDTKMSLTTLEARHIPMEETTAKQIRSLESQLQEKCRIIAFMEDAGLDTSQAGTTTTNRTIDQVTELKSSVTQWVNKTVINNKRQVDGGSVHGSTGTLSTNGSEEDSSSQQMFEHLRGKGNGLIERLKQKGGEELDKLKQKNPPSTGPTQVAAQKEKLEITTMSSD